MAKTKQSNHIRKLVQKNKRGVIVTLVLGVLWSWLFLVDVTNLAKSTGMGFALMMVAYVVMVALSSFVIVKTWPFIERKLKKPSWQSVVYILLVWAAVEFFLAWLVSAVWMGREGSWDNIVPFVSLTPITILTPLKFLTRLFGFFGTSAVVGTGIILLAASIKNAKWRKLTGGYWLIVIGLNIVLWLAFSSANGPNLTATIASEHLGRPQQINPGNSELVVVPEYGLDDYTSENLHERFTDNSREVFITGTKQYGESDGNSNVLVYGSNKQGFLYTNQKTRLIVGGEYLPLTYEIFVRAFAPNLYTDFTVRRAIQKGHEAPRPYILPSGMSIGNAACSSIINPDDYRKLTQQGASVLANSASLEVFRGSQVFAVHHDGLAKFMATANSRPFLQSANDWKSFVIDHNGNKLMQIEPASQTEVAIKTNTRKTPYTFLGEWFSYLGIVFMGFLIIKKLRTNHN